MASSHEFTVAATYDQTRAIVEPILQANGYRVTYPEPFTSIAERGSRAATYFGGALAGSSQHMKMSVRYFTAPTGECAVLLQPATTGMAAGVIGVNQTTDALNLLVSQMGNEFIRLGLLRAGRWL